MADVRSLLRNERAARRIDHPQASYSATGTLECTVCHIPLKSDFESWNKHLKSTQHAMRAERLRLSTKNPPSPSNPSPTTREPNNKKRKADTGDHDDARKKSRPSIDLPATSFDETTEIETSEIPPTQPHQPEQPPSQKSKFAPTASEKATESIDENEWAAFERDIAVVAPPEPTPNTSALTATATISAAPLSAAELAAQTREEASRRMKAREEDMEGEKEDAARALEEEFEEMEGLEERVKRLRERREELRLQREREREAEVGVGAVEAKRREDEGESEEGEEFDEWGAWGR